MSKLRVLLVGLGSMGVIMATALDMSDDWELVAAADPLEANRFRFAERHRRVQMFADSSEACSKEFLDRFEIDFVAIASPPNTHAKLSILVLEAGRHVLCEKPLAVSKFEAAGMVDFAAVHSSSLALVDFQMRFNLARRWLRDCVFKGTIGSPMLVTAVGGYPAMIGSPWTWWSDLASGGGVLNEYGSHIVDLLLWIFGPAERADGLLRTGERERRYGNGVRNVDSDDITCFHLTWSSGLVADVVLSTYLRPGPRRLEVHGELGSVVVDEQDVVTHFDGNKGIVVGSGARETIQSLIGAQIDTYTPPFVRMISEIADAVRDHREPVDAATFSDGLRVIQLLDEVRASSNMRIGGSS